MRVTCQPAMAGGQNHLSWEYVARPWSHTTFLLEVSPIKYKAKPVGDQEEVGWHKEGSGRRGRIRERDPLNSTV